MELFSDMTSKYNEKRKSINLFLRLSFGALLLVNMSLASANCQGEYLSNATQGGGVTQCANASFTAPGADKVGSSIDVFCVRTGYALGLHYPASFGAIPVGTPFTLNVDNNEPISGSVGMGSVGIIVLYDTSSYNDSENGLFWTLIKQMKKGQLISLSVNNIVSAVIPLAGFTKIHKDYCSTHYQYKKTL